MNGVKFFSFVLAVITVKITTSAGLSPILIVPGYTGSQLEAKITDTTHDCNTKDLWNRYWANKDMSDECINIVLTLRYDDVTNTYSNLTGIEVRVPGFGDTDTVEYLDKMNPQYSAYFSKFVEYFVSKGYVRGKTIRAAPYDWRLAAGTLKNIGYYQSVKSLVEEMYSTAYEKVSIVVHSMGGPVTLYFLNNIVSQDWKDKYIKAFIPLSGAWSGGNGALVTYISAIKSGIEKPFGKSFQSMESTAWLQPNPSVWKDKVIVTTEKRNFTAKQYKEMYDSIERDPDYDRIRMSLLLNGDYPAPEVPTYCFYGIGVDTIEVVNYGSGFPEHIESITNGDGDGSVNLLSSEVCLKWANQTAPFTNQTFPKVHHGDMVTSNTVLAAVEGAVNHH